MAVKHSDSLLARVHEAVLPHLTSYAGCRGCNKASTRINTLRRSNGVDDSACYVEVWSGT